MTFSGEIYFSLFIIASKQYGTFIPDELRKSPYWLFRKRCNKIAHMKTSNVQRQNISVRSTARRLMRRSPLWLTFSLLLAVFLLILTAILTYSSYRRGVDTTIRQQETSVSQLMEMKLRNLDNYLSELSDFCVLPVNDSEFYNDLLSTKPLESARVSELKQTVTMYYYSRTDLLSYRLSMLRHDLCFSRSASDQRMKTIAEEFDYDDPIYLECLRHASHYAITPSENSAALFTFSHTIFRINDKTPIALVSIDVSKSAMTSGFDDQIVALFNTDGEFLYTNTPSMKSELASLLADHKGAESSTQQAVENDRSVRITIQGESYVVLSRTDSFSGLSLVVLLPLSSVTEELRSIQRSTLLQGLLFLLFSLAVSCALIRYLTQPLTALADFQLQVGSGQYPTIHLGRCREAAELGRSFNEMSEHIDRLVNDNLMASLNEKNARIEALEAQVNPHFLYNTLQAIGSEALMNDEPKLYDMITKLASNMRYSINGSKEVTLEQELNFTDNYIELQKLRMDERLQVTRRIDRNLLRHQVPKCSIQLIVENSIKYGLSGDIRCLHLEIDVFAQGGQLVIRVRDDGAGMTPARLDEVRQSLQYFQSMQAASNSTESSGIGLANLCNRLKIMYDDKAEMQIMSSNRANDHYTCITLVLET